MYFLLYIKIFFRDTRSVNLNVYINVVFFPPYLFGIIFWWKNRPNSAQCTWLNHAPLPTNKSTHTITDLANWPIQAAKRSFCRRLFAHQQQLSTHTHSCPLLPVLVAHSAVNLFKLAINQLRPINTIIKQSKLDSHGGNTDVICEYFT